MSAEGSGREVGECKPNERGRVQTERKVRVQTERKGVSVQTELLQQQGGVSDEK